MVTQETNLQMVTGDTLAFGVEIEGLTQDLEEAYFSAKVDPESEEYIFSKTLQNGITKVDTGKYRVRVAPEDTADVQAGTYYYDLRIGINSDIYTIMRGKLKMVFDVTEITEGA